MAEFSTPCPGSRTIEHNASVWELVSSSCSVVAHSELAKLSVPAVSQLMPISTTLQQSVGPADCSADGRSAPPSSASAGSGSGSEEAEQARLATVPFLLQLANLSPMLLTTLSTEIAKTGGSALSAGLLLSLLPPRMASVHRHLPIADRSLYGLLTP